MYIDWLQMLYILNIPLYLIHVIMVVKLSFKSLENNQSSESKLPVCDFNNSNNNNKFIYAPINVSPKGEGEVFRQGVGIWTKTLKKIQMLQGGKEITNQI